MIKIKIVFIMLLFLFILGIIITYAGSELYSLDMMGTEIINVTNITGTNGGMIIFE